MLELKNWKEYTIEEKKQILQHWWNYYGKHIYSLEEYEIFRELLENKIDLVFTSAVINFMFGISSEPLIQAMRQNELDELFIYLAEFEEAKEKVDDFQEIENLFLREVVTTLNNPQPSVPMDITIFVVSSQDEGLRRKKPSKNNQSNIIDFRQNN